MPNNVDGSTPNNSESSSLGEELLVFRAGSRFPLQVEAIQRSRSLGQQVHPTI